jgi:acetyltransferase-like isoleucine patch superfamily enzyme
MIIIEDGCVFNRGCMLFAKNRIHIGRNTIFGPSVFITDHNHAYEDVTIDIGLQGVTPGGTIRIEEGSWIGFGAAIVGNQGELVIGRHSAVGANSMVSRSVSPYSVVIGNPARTARHYDLSTEKWVLGARAAALNN